MANAKRNVEKTGSQACGSRERMRRLRERRKAEGWKSVTVEVPEGHEASVRAAAERARRMAETGEPEDDAEPKEAGRERDEATGARAEAPGNESDDPDEDFACSEREWSPRKRGPVAEVLATASLVGLVGVGAGFSAGFGWALFRSVEPFLPW